MAKIGLQQVTTSVVGTTINFLTILEVFQQKGAAFCKVKCQCGNEKICRLNGVTRGYTKSCGCYFLQVCEERKLLKTNLKYNYNTQFFKTLTEDSAYVLGLLYTDGCLAGKSYTFSIALTLEEDSILLEKIGVLLRNSTFLGKGRNYILSCQYKEMYYDLIDWGLYPNKSLTLAPDVRLTSNRDFWRGCIDGDGSIYYSRNTLHISFCGTSQMVSGFKNFCEEYINSDAEVSPNKGLTNFCKYTLSGLRAKIIINILYKNSSLYLDRKQRFLFSTIRQLK